MNLLTAKNAANGEIEPLFMAIRSGRRPMFVAEGKAQNGRNCNSVGQKYLPSLMFGGIVRLTGNVFTISQELQRKFKAKEVGTQICVRLRGERGFAYLSGSFPSSVEKRSLKVLLDMKDMNTTSNIRKVYTMD